MNPYSGEIERFASASAVPGGWLQLTEAEAEEFARLPNDVRLEHYVKNHRNDKCGSCGCFVGNHSLKKFKECSATELARIDTARHEKSMKQMFDTLPTRTLEDSLSMRGQLGELEAEMKP
jgi:hypothetical protein